MVDCYRASTHLIDDMDVLDRSWPDYDDGLTVKCLILMLIDRQEPISSIRWCRMLAQIDAILQMQKAYIQTQRLTQILRLTHGKVMLWLPYNFLDHTDTNHWTQLPDGNYINGERQAGSLLLMRSNLSFRALPLWRRTFSQHSYYFNSTLDDADYHRRCSTFIFTPIIRVWPYSPQHTARPAMENAPKISAQF